MLEQWQPSSRSASDRWRASYNTIRGSEDLLDGAGSGALEETLDLELGKSKSLEGVENAGEASGGAIDKDSSGVGDVNNNNNFAQVFSKVHVSNSAWLNEVLENLQKQHLDHSLRR